MKNNLKIVSRFIAVTLLSSTLSVVNAESYVELQTGKVSFNDILVNEGTFYGLGMRNLYTLEKSPLLYGFEGSLGANKDIGMMEAGVNLGGNIKLTPSNNLKLYTILGYGVQVTDDFQGRGLYYGIGATYDVAKYFAVTFNYKKHTTEFESVEEDSDLKFDADVNTLLLSLAFKF